MRASRLFLPTLRQVPTEATLVSHQLLLRAGFIRTLTAGIYSYLPLGYRVLQKISQIVREEMNAMGAQEMLMPFVQPAELWRETGRYEAYGDTLAKFKDRRGQELCLGPTHEEVITAIVRQHVRSYRDLPLILYQIQTKFRDEPRPRGGLLRGREFLMKDAYSFDKGDVGLDQSYQAMCNAYQRVLRRCGLDFLVAEAESGEIGGSESAEFMVLCDSGEDAVALCNRCGYVANLEKAERRAPVQNQSVGALRSLERVSTPGQRTVEEVTKFLGVRPDQLVKTLVYLADGKPIAALIRGDTELNEQKLRRVLSVQSLQMADAETIERLTGAPVGFTGPVGLESIKIIADYDLLSMSDFVTGANERDAHYINVNIGRDVRVERFADLRWALSGDSCPCCDGQLELKPSIEIGHVFKLGTKYSQAMHALFTDGHGVERPIIMGCYGIGISRILATIAEISHDEKGLIWPISVAPYDCWIVNLATSKDDAIGQVAEHLYRSLQELGLDVVLDDRLESAGVKFKDADLIGVPIQIVIGRRLAETGSVEVRLRAGQGRWEVPLAEIAVWVQKKREELMRR
jgi:prolyl-tRNA synthetase